MPDYILTVTDADFDERVIESSRRAPVVVDFWAPWCGPCRQLTPLLERLAREYQGRFTLVKVNADDSPELSRRYDVRSIPSVMAFVEGEVVDQFLGAQPGDLVGPMRAGDEFVVYLIERKLLPSASDPEIRVLAEDGVLGHVLKQQLDHHVEWHAVLH